MVNKRINIKNSLLNIIYDNLYFYHLYKLIQSTDLKSAFKNKFELRDVIVCGMPRSGSTMIYNIVKEILKNKLVNTDIYFFRDNQLHEIYKNEISLLVKKNHRYSSLAVKRIRRGHSVGIFTHRDIRDVVVSMIQKGWITDFEQWINERKLKKIVNDSLLYAKTKNMIVIGYEKLTSQRSFYVKEIAKVLNVQLSDEEIESVLIKTDITSAKNKISNLTVDQIDPESHLHENHIKDGLIGKWKNILTTKQIKIINQQAENYLNYFGYKI